MAIPLRVLIVEDSEDDALLLLRELAQGGYDPVYERVEKVEDMHIALTEGRWDIIIADYRMPLFSGLAALELLHETGQDIPFIIISGTVGEEIAVEALKLGAHDYIMKDNLIRLIPAVRRALRDAEVRCEYRRAEEALLESELTYRELAESISDVFFAMDEDLRYTYWNRASEELTGISAEDALGKIILEIFPDVEETAAEEVYREVLESGQPRSFVTRYTLRGEEYFFEISAYPTRRGLSVIARDITGRRKSEERLAKLNQCLLNLGADPLENIERIVADGLQILGGVLMKYWRLQGEAYSCFTVKSRLERYEVTEKRIPRPAFEELFLWASGPIGAGDEGASALAEVDEDIKRYGIRSVIGFPVSIREEIIGCICLLDEAEEDFSREEVEIVGMLARAISIEEERWIDEKGLRDFIEIASHELRHPITIMKGYALTLKELESKMDEEIRAETLESIDRGANRLNHLLNELLDTTRIERGKYVIRKREVALRVIVDAALIEAKAKHEDSIFSVRLKEGIDTLEVDPKAVSQLLEALLDNAAKFSPLGSEIEIEAELDGERVVISVLDRGEGIPDNEREKVFQRFYQVGDVEYHSVPGIGLGLYIAKQIVEGHGGRIWYEPREGGGSAFRLILPLSSRP